jgi:hypothetical protein
VNVTIIDGVEITQTRHGKTKKTSFRAVGPRSCLPMSRLTELTGEAERMFAVARVNAKGPLEWPDLEAIVKQRRPMRDATDLPKSGRSTIAPGGWHDSNRDEWGRPKGNRTTWSGGNCLKACIATIRGLPIGSVPDPTEDFAAGDGWLDQYDKRLQTACGLRLERIEPYACGHDPNALWIAGIRGEVYGDDTANHALVARGRLVWHDPASDHLRGQPVPWDDLLFGLGLVPANAPRTDRWGRPIQ